MSAKITFKHFLFILLSFVALCQGNAQTSVLYDNGTIITHPGGGAGGSDMSLVEDDCGVTGFFNDEVFPGGCWFTDNFEVTSDAWQIDSMVFFGIIKFSGLQSPLNSLKVRIWDGMPRANGSHLIWGTNNNILYKTYWSGIYRCIFTSDTYMPVMKNVAKTDGVILNRGNYYVEWTQRSSSTTQYVMTPPVPGRDGNTYQMQSDNSWLRIADNNHYKDIPFVIYGSTMTSIENKHTGINPITSIYPNPSNGIINIENAENNFAEVYNLFGQLIFKKLLTNAKQQIDLSSYTAGTYVIKLSKDNNCIYQKVNLVK